MVSVSDDEGFFRAVGAHLELTRWKPGPQLDALISRVTGLFEQYVKLSQNLNYETMIAAIRVDDPGKLADTVGANLQLTIEEKQELLEIFDPIDRLTRVAEMLDIEIEKLERGPHHPGPREAPDGEGAERVLPQREDQGHPEGTGPRRKERDRRAEEEIEAAGMTKDALEKAMAELKRLENMPPMSAESTVSRNYLDWLLAVPWKKKSKEIRDLKFAEQVLEADHYGLEKIKERILEFLAVRRLVKNPKGSILCFVGPPGVGKTSLGMSIAKATGRKFVRMSLGGVRDEAEIRGHRRTYIGALPGQIIQMMKKAGTRNPVFMLDEVDKMSMDFRGDPSAALLEVLDPEQNYMFVDHYLDVEYDLSQVFFIATANVLHTIPPALQDRMEVIRLSGYTELEKMEIAKRFLVRKQMEADRACRRTRSSSPTTGLQRADPVLHARSRRAQPGARDRQRLPQGRAPGGERAERQGQEADCQGGDQRREAAGAAGPVEVPRPARRRRRTRSARRSAWPGPKSAARF